MQALGPYLIGVRPTGLTLDQGAGVTAIARSGHVDWVIFLMRLGNLPFFLAACFVVAAWGNIFSRSIAVLSLALFTLLPTVLADAGLATTDMALGATVGGAFLAFIYWSKKPTLSTSLLLGLCTALACLSKFTALGYLPAAGALALICYIAINWPCWRGGYLPRAGVLALAWQLVAQWPGWHDLWQLAKRRLAPFAIAVSTAALLIWACYWFSVGSGTLHGIHFSGLPAPEFFDGLQVAFHHSRDGHGAFLLGKFSWTGWWYYFPVVLLLKTPIPFLILFFLGVIVCVREKARPMYVLPLAFSIGILLPAMVSHVDIGVRHVEPIYIGLSIIAGLGLRQMLQWARSGVASLLTAGLLIVWMIVSVGIQHPDYLAYVNAFAGKRPENALVDSNYDWGQDLKLLAKRLHELGVQEFSMASLDGVSTKNSSYSEAWYGLPAFKFVNTCVPAPGWNVVSPTIEKALSRWPNPDDLGEFRQFDRGPGMPKPWYEQIAPTERVGPLLLYYVPPDAHLDCIAAQGPRPGAQ